MAVGIVVIAVGVVESLPVVLWGGVRAGLVGVVS